LAFLKQKVNEQQCVAFCSLTVYIRHFRSRVLNFELKCNQKVLQYINLNYLLENHNTKENIYINFAIYAAYTVNKHSNVKDWSSFYSKAKQSITQKRDFKSH